MIVIWIALEWSTAQVCIKMCKRLNLKYQPEKGCFPKFSTEGRHLQNFLGNLCTLRQAAERALNQLRLEWALRGPFIKG